MCLLTRKARSLLVAYFIRAFRTIFTIVIVLGYAVQADSAPGDLDTTFGRCGKVVSEFPPPVSYASASAIGLQSDGKIVAAGNADDGFNPDFAVARYDVDGRLDPTFGINGKTQTDFGAHSFDQALALVVQPDNKIVLTGTTNAILPDEECAMARYDANGNLDVTFGQGGVVIFGSRILSNISANHCSALVLQPDGKLLIGGSVYNSFFDVGGFELARYNSDGTPDSTFGVDGFVITLFDDVYGQYSAGGINALSILPDGKILAAGGAGSFTGPPNFALARYNSDGTLDSSFGSNGKVVTILGGQWTFNVANAIGLQVDGKAVVAGESNASGSRDFVLARYNEDGTIDDAFGSDGVVVTHFGGQGSADVPLALAIQGDQRILVAGFTDSIFGANFALARYDANGSFDSTFGQGGIVVTDFIAQMIDGATALVQSNGKIAVAGFTNSGGSFTFALARYFSDFGTVSEEADNLALQAGCLPASANFQRKLSGNARSIPKAVKKGNMLGACKSAQKLIDQIVLLEEKKGLAKSIGDPLIYSVLKFGQFIGC